MKKGEETSPRAESEGLLRVRQTLRARRRGEKVSDADLRLNYSLLLETDVSLWSGKSRFRSSYMRTTSREKNGQYGKAVSAERGLP